MTERCAWYNFFTRNRSLLPSLDPQEDRPTMPLQEGFGLKKLRSYASGVGGSVELSAREEFAVILRLPL